MMSSAVSIPIITVDGPSGVGKGTLCQLLANALGWHLLDSGAIYRVLALAALNLQIPLTDETKLAELARNLALEFKMGTEQVDVLLNHEVVSLAIRREDVGIAASKVAALGQVRQALLERQRAFRQAPGLIADGRDMGTVVFPEAPIKLFLDASAQARAERRMKQLQDKQICATFAQILQEINARDERDRNRLVAPLKPAADAWVIDTTSLSITEVFNQVLSYVKSKII